MARTTTELKLKTIASRASTGACGSTMITGTDETSGPFSAFTALADATIDYDGCTTNIQGLAADFTVPKGVTVFGDFTSLKLTANSTVIAYYNCD